ncbi:Zn-dependent amino-or carboxypeptidase, M28 family [Janthinobacterium sp. TND4EL3]|uniref:M28 family peptidase n=1 Tax=Janthinobacterium sp. TND4EL3 TaxID=1907311 RepID=UPI000953EED8|nr:M28 family peptidase [Janthinobacterium sp. TND4EL3]SIQ54594.1 Zn-dependent amino-or carboxypeptidase, M28 family [Janthinobacterium sp. TND4EL3]
MQKLFSSLALTALAFSAQAATSLPVVQEAPLRAHLAFLSNDLLEGRGTGQRGADLTVAYLETQAQMAGLKPVRGNSYRQSVQIAGVKSLPAESSLQAVAGGKAVPLAFGPDWVWATGDSVAAHTFDAPLVFVGYGITAPEEGWNDFKGADVKNKIVVMMVNDPQPTTAEPNRFAGKALTYYGRWTYKFEEAKRQGAAGVLLIHTKPSASYDWSVVQNSWSGSERFQLADRTAGTPLQGWIAEDAARRLFAAGGQDLDALRAKAESKDFQAVALNAKLSGDMKSAVRKVEQFNIAGMVQGTDPALKDEAVIYSGHWDHLGKQGKDDEKAGDTIYNGAVDNASGTAGLLAMAQEAVKKPAKRTQIFLWVAAEEQGLLGSAAYAADPLWPLDKTAAALNLDSLNFVGATHDIGAQGSERTELGAMAAATAKAMGMHIAAARPDLAGGYFRSDHFSFAKAGVPAFSINGGREYIKDVAASKAKAAAYGPRYHQVTDEYDASWDLSGMTQQAQFTLNLGQVVANAAKMPAWKAGDAFGKARGQAK